MDLERAEKILFTFAKICVEIDLSKCLPDHIQLKHKKFQWSQVIEYENMAFRSHILSEWSFATCIPPGKKES